MINKEDLFDGMLVRARKPRGNMHKEFSLWTNGLHWLRFRTDFGQLIGFYDAERMLQYLNKYEFEIIGKYELKMFAPKENSPNDPFHFKGAL